MKTLKINNNIIKVYDSIDEMPIVNFQKYNKYLLIDAGIGSDADDVDSHLVKIAKFIKLNDKAKALQELQNMRQNIYMINSKISPKYLAFAALICEINGEKVSDLSDDNLKDILVKIKEAKHSEVVRLLTELKKKIGSELDTYFPGTFIGPKEKEAYNHLKTRALYVLESVINEVDNTEKINEVDDILFSSYSPNIFIGKDSVEIKYDKQFENACLLISQKTNMDTKKMTVLQFYNALDNIRQQAENEAKSLKRK